MNVKKPLVIMAAMAGTFVLCQCSSEAPPPPDAPPAQLAEEYGLGLQALKGKCTAAGVLSAVLLLFALLDSGVPEKCTAMQAIGYKEMAAALRGDGDVDRAAREIQLRSRQYAKRQLTWFRRNGAAKWITWDSEPNFAQALQVSTGYLEDFGI